MSKHFGSLNFFFLLLCSTLKYDQIAAAIKPFDKIRSPEVIEKNLQKLIELGLIERINTADGKQVKITESGQNALKKRIWHHGIESNF